MTARNERCDWRSLFVYDQKIGFTLIVGATLEDVAQRHENYLREVGVALPASLGQTDRAVLGDLRKYIASLPVGDLGVEAEWVAVLDRLLGAAP